MRTHILAGASSRATLLLFAMLALSACASTAMAPSSPMKLARGTFAPRGYLKFCERRPDQCGLASPIAQGDRANLEKIMLKSQWSQVFNAEPLAISDAEHASPPRAPAEKHLPVLFNQDPWANDRNLAQYVMEPEPGPQLAVVIAEDRTTAGPADSDGGQMAKPALPVLRLSETAWAAVDGINRSINAKIHPMDDEAAFGERDYWTLPLSDGPRPVGNCKHYVLEKRKALVEAGFNPAALSIAIVSTRWNEVHAVLVISTDQGDYVLDNLSPWIKGWREAPYRWIERQIPGEPLHWATVSDPSVSAKTEVALDTAVSASPDDVGARDLRAGAMSWPRWRSSLVLAGCLPALPFAHSSPSAFRTPGSGERWASYFP